MKEPKSKTGSAEGERVDLGGGPEDGAPKRSSYEGADGAGAAADLVLVQADPEGAAARAADMGAAFPWGRRPKSRARRPWKSSMAAAAAGGSADLGREHHGPGARARW